jgi:hypothetical protein
MLSAIRGTKFCLLACLLLLSFLFCFSVYSEVERRGPLWDKYQHVQVGMTEKEVTDILGPADDQLDFSFRSISYWNDGSHLIEIDFRADWRTGQNSVVYTKAFLPRTWWDAVVEWWKRR